MVPHCRASAATTITTFHKVTHHKIIYISFIQLQYYVGIYHCIQIGVVDFNHMVILERVPQKVYPAPNVTQLNNPGILANVRCNRCSHFGITHLHTAVGSLSKHILVRYRYPEVIIFRVNWHPHAIQKWRIALTVTELCHAYVDPKVLHPRYCFIPHSGREFQVVRHYFVKPPRILSAVCILGKNLHHQCVTPRPGVTFGTILIYHCETHLY